MISITKFTLLTVQHRDGTTFCAPIGHRQEGGDYQESWQPQAMSADALAESQAIAAKVTAALGGWGYLAWSFLLKAMTKLFF